MKDKSYHLYSVYFIFASNQVLQDASYVTLQLTSLHSSSLLRTKHSSLHGQQVLWRGRELGIPLDDLVHRLQKVFFSRDFAS